MPMNRGLHYRRVKYNPREKALADHWERECKAQAGFNFGHGIAQDLMCVPNKQGKFYMKHKLSAKDRMLMATVIQWLGSNCGICFLQDALKSCGEKIAPMKRGDADE